MKKHLVHSVPMKKLGYGTIYAYVETEQPGIATIEVATRAGKFTQGTDSL